MHKTTEPTSVEVEVGRESPTVCGRRSTRGKAPTARARHPCAPSRRANARHLCDVTAPAPIEAGDLVASAEQVYRVEVVLVPPPGAPVSPVLVRPVELDYRRLLTT